MIELGDTLVFSSKLYDKDPAAGGVLVNPVTATLTITLPPDPLTGVSTTVTPTITVPPSVTGTFTYPYPTTVTTGRYVGRWLFTLANGQTSGYSETFDVRSSDPGFVVSLADAKDHLDIPAATTRFDEELRSWLAGITRVAEAKVGVCVPRTVTDRLVGQHGSQSGGYEDFGYIGGACERVIRLRVTPVIAVTSMTASYTTGRTYAPSEFQVTDDGRLTRVNGWHFIRGPWDITYRAGRSDIPPNVTQGAKIIMAHLWETQRGAGKGAFRGGDDTVTPPGFGFAVPNRALEMFEPDDLGPQVG